MPTPTNPLGVKGAGEAGTVGALPAVVNAIVDALSLLGDQAHRHAGDAVPGVAGDPIGTPTAGDPPPHQMKELLPMKKSLFAAPGRRAACVSPGALITQRCSRIIAVAGHTGMLRPLG